MLPPLISLLRLLTEMGEKVTYVGLIESDETSRILQDVGVQFRLYPYRQVRFRQAPFVRLWQKVTEWIRPYLKRQWLWKMLYRFNLDMGRDIIWSVEMEGAAILGDAALRLGRRHIHTFYELGDKVGSNYLGFTMQLFLHSATIVECEYNRAHIFKVEMGLERLPFVLPNKPHLHPRMRNLRISDETARKVVDTWGDRRVILYQGGVQSDRGALALLIESLCRAFPSAIIAVMGRKTPIVDRLLATYSNFSYVPFVSPPHHLEVTSHADVGLAFYEGGSVYGLSPLNPVYCAPNKIYEYAGFGIPLLCNDIPGLYYSVGISGAGECLSRFDVEAVKDSCKRIFDDYESYQARAVSFFEAVDLKQRVTDVLQASRL